jgi:hypothetical protein
MENSIAIVPAHPNGTALWSRFYVLVPRLFGTPSEWDQEAKAWVSKLWEISERTGGEP